MLCHTEVESAVATTTVATTTVAADKKMSRIVDK